MEQRKRNNGKREARVRMPKKKRGGDFRVDHFASYTIAIVQKHCKTVSFSVK